MKWWFQICFLLSPIRAKFPSWLIFPTGLTPSSSPWFVSCLCYILCYPFLEDFHDMFFLMSLCADIQQQCWRLSSKGRFTVLLVTDLVARSVPCNYGRFTYTTFGLKIMIFRYKYSSPYHHRSYLLYRHPRICLPVFCEVRCRWYNLWTQEVSWLCTGSDRNIDNITWRYFFPKLTWIRLDAMLWKKRYFLSTIAISGGIRDACEKRGSYVYWCR